MTLLTLWPKIVLNSADRASRGPRAAAENRERVPRLCTLDGFVEGMEGTSGVNVSELDPLTVLHIETYNSVYRVVVLRVAWAHAPGCPRHRPGHICSSSHVVPSLECSVPIVPCLPNTRYGSSVVPFPRVLVQGGAFFPERTRACLSGSSFGGSCLKLGWVGVGLRLEFHFDDQWIITSHVRSIMVDRSATTQPC